MPLAGNWDGGATVGDASADHIGAYDPDDGRVLPAELEHGGRRRHRLHVRRRRRGLVPVAGDWNGDGTTTVGLYSPATGAFFLRNTNSSGPADIVFTFGPGGAGFVPIVGDWNNDSIDTVGLYDPVTGDVLPHEHERGGRGGPRVHVRRGGGQPMAGDWNDDGTDTVGLYIPLTGTIFLKNANAPGPADRTYGFGSDGRAHRLRRKLRRTVNRVDLTASSRMTRQASRSDPFGETSGAAVRTCFGFFRELTLQFPRFKASSADHTRIRGGQKI